MPALQAAEVPAGYEPDNKECAIQLTSNEAQELWLLQLPHEQGVHTVPIAKRMTVYQSDILQAPAEEDAAGASEPATSPGADEPALPLAGRPKGLQAAHEKAKRSKRKQEAGNVAETAHAPVPAADQVQHKQKKRKKRRSEETGLQADDSQKEGAADLGKKKKHRKGKEDAYETALK